jgi:chromosome segregation ATPase
LADANARKEERWKEIARFDSRRFELTSRLNEAETSLHGLDTERTSSRERETQLQKQIEELRVSIDPTERELEMAEQEEARFGATPKTGSLG